MPGNRPTEISNVGSQILPASLVLFQGLKRAYASELSQGRIIRLDRYFFSHANGGLELG